MPQELVAATLALFLFAASPEAGQSQGDSQSQNFQDHVITVSRAGEAYAKPDLGILVMSIQSAGPIAEECVAENARKARAVESSLAGLGFTQQAYKITSVTFGQAGGRVMGAAQPDITAYEAAQFVYVFFEAPDLRDVPTLTQKVAAVIEALRKAGAAPAKVGGPRMPTTQGALIIYTIKDSAPYEKQALQQAIARARDAAQDVAAGTGVQITGLRSVKSSFLYGNYGPRSGQSSLEGLNYRWYSEKNDELEIGASATVDYEFK